MRELQSRLDMTEHRQTTMINFLAQVAQNPALLQQVCSQLPRLQGEQPTAALAPVAHSTKLPKRHREYASVHSKADNQHAP